MKIKKVNFEDRPRERLKKVGTEALSNSELLAIILQKGSRRFGVMDLSNHLINKFGLEKLGDESIYELTKITGIGEAKACQIKSLYELIKRYNKIKRNLPQKISLPEDVYKYYVDDLVNKKKEYFYVLLLDTKNQVIDSKLISIGTLNSSLIHPREVFNNAIRDSANSIILVHNHPSGDPTPSKEDIKITKKFKKVGEMLGIKVVDHVIIGKDAFRSVI